MSNHPKNYIVCGGSDVVYYAKLAQKAAESLKSREFMLRDCAWHVRKGHPAYAGVFEPADYAAYLAINAHLRAQWFDRLTIRFPPPSGAGAWTPPDSVAQGLGLGAFSGDLISHHFAIRVTGQDWNLSRIFKS